MVFHPNLPSERPALIEALAVWGWAVAHGGIPLGYAAQALADHPAGEVQAWRRDICTTCALTSTGTCSTGRWSTSRWMVGTGPSRIAAGEAEGDPLRGAEVGPQPVRGPQDVEGVRVAACRCRVFAGQSELVEGGVQQVVGAGGRLGSDAFFVGRGFSPGLGPLRSGRRGRRPGRGHAGPVWSGCATHRS